MLKIKKETINRVKTFTYQTVWLMKTWTWQRSKDQQLSESKSGWSEINMCPVNNKKQDCWRLGEPWLFSPSHILSHTHTHTYTHTIIHNASEDSRGTQWAKHGRSTAVFPMSNLFNVNPALNNQKNKNKWCSFTHPSSWLTAGTDDGKLVAALDQFLWCPRAPERTWAVCWNGPLWD